MLVHIILHEKRPDLDRIRQENRPLCMWIAYAWCKDVDVQCSTEMLVCSLPDPMASFMLRLQVQRIDPQTNRIVHMEEGREDGVPWPVCARKSGADSYAHKMERRTVYKTEKHGCTAQIGSFNSVVAFFGGKFSIMTGAKRYTTFPTLRCRLILGSKPFV